jgi:hypothetical protein
MAAAAVPRGCRPFAKQNYVSSGAHRSELDPALHRGPLAWRGAHQQDLVRSPGRTDHGSPRARWCARGAVVRRPRHGNGAVGRLRDASSGSGDGADLLSLPVTDRNGAFTTLPVVVLPILRRRWKRSRSSRSRCRHVTCIARLPEDPTMTSTVHSLGHHLHWKRIAVALCLALLVAPRPSHALFKPGNVGLPGDPRIDPGDPRPLPPPPPPPAARDPNRGRGLRRDRRARAGGPDEQLLKQPPGGAFAASAA